MPEGLANVGAAGDVRLGPEKELTQPEVASASLFSVVKKRVLEKVRQS